MSNKRQTAIFCSQLQSLLSSGIPLIEALIIIKDLTKEKKLLDNVINKVSEGNPFSEAINGFLPIMAASSLRAAERAGDLEECLGRLTEYYNNKAELDEKLIGSLIYPVLIMVLSLLSVLMLVIFVIPSLKGLLNDFGGSLPLVTVIILSVSDYFSAIWLVSAIIIGLFLFYLVKIRDKDPLRFERYLFKVPFFGRLYQEEQMIQCLSTLGSLLKGGAPIIESLAITGEGLKNKTFKNIINNVKDEVENGERLSVAFERHNYWPSSVVQMIKVGERTGGLAEMLVNIADFKAREREVFLKRFTSLLEPGMTVVVGLVVGFIVLAMFLPMMNVVSTLQ
ncbi:MAG: type II secretion system F family protein [bacterium]